jgi:hypothetical protein
VASEMKLKSGWLMRDVNKASARLAEWSSPKAAQSSGTGKPTAKPLVASSTRDSNKKIGKAH